MKPFPPSNFPPSHLILRKAELAAHWHAFLDFDRADRRTSGAACLAYRATCVGEVFWAVYLRLHAELVAASRLAAVASLVLVLAACGGAPFTGLSESVPISASDAASDSPSTSTSTPDSPSTSPPDSAPTSALPDGAGEAAPGGDGGAALPPCACSGDLSDVGLGDFTIALEIAIHGPPTSPGYFPLANQRRTCDAQSPGWELSVVWSGELAMQVYDGSNVFDNAQTSAKVDDGMAHRVVVRRLGGSVIEVDVDGEAQRFAGQPPEDLSGQLAAMLTRVEPVCAGNTAAPSEPTQGTVEGLCVAAGACEPPR